MSFHPKITRAKYGIFKTRHLANLGVLGSSGLLSAILASTEPRRFKSTTKNSAQFAVVDEKIRVLQQNDTQILVPRPAKTNILRSKCVFHIKYLPNESVERCRAHLDDKYYTQVPYNAPNFLNLS